MAIIGKFQYISIQNHEIGGLSDLDRARFTLTTEESCTTDGIRIDHISDRYGLARVDERARIRDHRIGTGMLGSTMICRDAWGYTRRHHRHDATDDSRTTHSQLSPEVFAKLVAFLLTSVREPSQTEYCYPLPGILPSSPGILRS